MSAPATAPRFELDVYLDHVERNEVTEWNQLGCPLGGLNPRQARHSQRVPLGQVVLFQLGEGVLVELDTALGHGPTKRGLFGGHIDHLRLTGVICVCQLRHFRQTSVRHQGIYCLVQDSII